MLDRQTAQERLKEVHVEDWMERRVARAGTLPGNLRATARALLGYDKQGKPLRGREQTADAIRRAVPQFEKLSQRKRQRVFKTLFPELVHHVERAWKLAHQIPYQTGIRRKAFRAPNTPAVSQWSRWGWLQGLVQAVRGYEQDITWFAAWAPYLRWGASHLLGLLFAAAIENGGSEGDAVFDILVASAAGEHEIGAMGRHIPRALLTASRPDGWDFLERLLLAAQRQEGLRQTILESVDEAHPEAFSRMLRLILEHDLTRFSATVRAANVWFGLGWDIGDARVVKETLQQALHLLEDGNARRRALEDEDAQTLFLALWAVAFWDVIPAFQAAAPLLDNANVERRFVGTHFLGMLGLNKSQDALLSALGDEDLRVVVSALTGLHRIGAYALGRTDLFERIERIIPRFPATKQELEPIVWPWLKLSADRNVATSTLFWSLGERSPKLLIPYLSMMEPHNRESVARKLANLDRQDSEVRDTLFSLVGDRSRFVREQALEALAKHTVSEQEASQLETLLTRKAGDLRRGVLSILINQSDEAVLASAERLMESSKLQQRLAGLDLLRQMVEAERASNECRAVAVQYRSGRSGLSDSEGQVLDLLLDQEQEVATLDDALGLMDPVQRTPPPVQPKDRGALVSFLGRRSPITPVALACLTDLDELVHRHRETPVTVEWGGSQKEELLGNLRGGFPRPDPDLSPEEDALRLPLQEVWENWWEERTDALRDSDGLELLRASAVAGSGLFVSSPFARRYEYPFGWQGSAMELLFAADEKKELQYAGVVRSVVTWLVRLYPQPGAVDLLLDAVECTCAQVPPKFVRQIPKSRNEVYWRSNRRLLGWFALARWHRSFFPESWTNADHVRLWELLRWLDEPAPLVPRYRPQLEDVLVAYEAGGATEADLVDLLLGPRPEPKHSYFSPGHGFGALRRVTPRKPVPLTESYPILRRVVDRCRERILEVELNRGEMPTAASQPALALRYAGGMETLVRLLQALGREKLVRGWTYDSLSKASVFSHLIRSTAPSDSDTPEDFAAAAEAAAISEKRLAELAVYAPQWARHVERALGWEGCADAVWWIHAHTKDTGWRVVQEIRELWAAQISEYTPLSSGDLLDGAVDVKWFFRAHRTLGSERWDRIYRVAKYASGGGGHKRAQLFADALLGQVENQDLITRLNEKRHKDTARALGLLPLAQGEARDQDLLERYRLLQEFLLTSRKFGAQRQASEKLATRIGMENLARTAGYPDPVRLEWAMEAEATADLVGAGKSVTEGEVTVTLSLNQLGEPELEIIKGERTLRSVPKTLKKDARVVDLRERRRKLKRQASRMRRSLEEAMSRGDQFSGADLSELLAHPVLAPMLRQLVFVGPDVTGYPISEGAALQFHDGSQVALRTQDRLRIAHPHDLLTTREWHNWQQECYQGERVQPFKQVFRELYLLTAAEKADETVSRRYAGHQVNSRQALALLGTRGWVNYPEEGVRRTFHDESISAWVTFYQGFYTPAEVEGLTVESVWFSRRGEWKPLPLTEVPPRLFSEAMRDLDLVVSVAHRGGVDPEASASTVEMRAALARETCALLKIDNVKLEGRYAMIEGSLSSYNVHLGSAMVHQQPGGAVCIVPVHAQHRGRLFLPFVDDDPKTAEVISKILLLARDTEIKDPVILEQIIGGR